MIKSILDDLAGNNSRLYKEDVLRQNASDTTFKEVCRLALDPFTQFYIRKIPDYSLNLNPKTQVPLAEALKKLDVLSSRTLTGNAGIDHLSFLLGSVSVPDAQVIERIIAKDLKCGVSDSTVNKIWPGLIPEYPCMLASAFDQKLVDKVKFPAIAQLKMDGMRFNAIVKNGVVEFRSRNGKEINIPNAEFGKPFLRMSEYMAEEMVLDGELLVVNDMGDVLDRKTGNGILNKAVKGTMSEKEAMFVRATLWDAVTVAAFEAGVDTTAYGYRLQTLSGAVAVTQSHYVNLAPTTMVKNIDEAKAKFEEYLAAGQEGIILKTADGPWENKRSKHLIKFKGELECDLLVVDWEEGTGKNRGRLGALVLESACGGIRVNVGTGFSDHNRDTITAGNSIGRIVAIKYNARISDKKTGVNSLFLPVFIEFRDDKDVADSDKDVK